MKKSENYIKSAEAGKLLDPNADTDKPGAVLVI